MKKHNFSAGPCVLPKEVIKQASKAVINFNNDNLSLIEISHRSKPFVRVMEEARNLDPRGFSALYQQQPSPEDGDLFQRENIQYYEKRKFKTTKRHELPSEGQTLSVTHVYTQKLTLPR